MRRLSLHLIVASFAFLVGVTAAYAFGLVFGSEKPRTAATSVTTWAEPPPPPKRSCPSSVREIPLPPSPPVVMVMPSAPEPPSPPAGSRLVKKQTRVIVRRADGTVTVIESGDGRIKKF